MIQDIILEEYVVLSGAVPGDGIHGSLYYNGYVYGSSREDTGLIKINKNDYSDRESFIFYGTQAYEDSGSFPLLLLEQIQRIGIYIYGKAPNYIFQFNTVTETYKTIKSFSLKDQPLVADDQYLYVSSIDKGFWNKISHADLIDSNRSKFSFMVESEFVAIYDITSQGAHIDYPEIYPNSLLIDEIYAHSTVVDDDFLYISFTSGGRNSLGYEDTPERPRYELHKVNKHTMQPAGWCFIAGATDDMCDNATHLFLGVELRYNSTYGRDFGLMYVDKATMTMKTLRYLDGSLMSANGYLSLRFGKYLMVGYIENNALFLLDLDRVSEWENEQFSGEFVELQFNLVAPSTSPTTVGYDTPNEAVYDSVDETLHFFFWNHGAGSTSKIGRAKLTNFDLSEPIIVTSQYTREISSNTVQLLASFEGGSTGQVFTNKGFEFGTTATLEFSQSFSVPVLDEFTTSVSDLEPNTDYYFRSFVTPDGGTTIYSSTQTFSFSEYRTVSAQYNREVASNSVKLLATIEGTNGASALLDKGFEFGTLADLSTAQIFDIPIANSFAIDMLDLAENTDYYFKAYSTYENSPTIFSGTLTFSFTHIYGLEGKVWETLDKAVFLEGANVGVIKMGESTIHSNLTTDANGVFRLELPDGLSDYMIFGNYIDSTRPIFPKRITPKIIG